MLRTFPRIALAAALACATPTVGVLVADHASASAAIALTTQDLVDRSDAIVVGVPKSKVARWEAGKLITYTTVAIDTAIAGDAKAGASVVVRTLGGKLDGIGQLVEGEAVLRLDEPMVLFLRNLPAKLAATSVSGARSVVGMSQGAMRIVVGIDKVSRVVPNVSGLALSTPPGVTIAPAHVALASRALTDATTDLRTSWTKRVAK